MRKYRDKSDGPEGKRNTKASREIPSPLNISEG